MLRKLPFSVSIALLDTALAISFGAQIFPNTASMLFGAKEITNSEWKDRLEKIKSKIHCKENIEFLSCTHEQIEILGKQVLVPLRYLEQKPCINNQERWTIVEREQRMVYTTEEIDAMIAFQIAGAEMGQEFSLWGSLLGLSLALKVGYSQLPLLLKPTTFSRVNFFKDPILVIPIAWGSLLLNSTNFDHRLARVSNSEYLIGLARQLRNELYYNKNYLRNGFFGYIRYSKQGNDLFGPFPYASTMLSRVYKEKGYTPPS